MSKNSAIIIGGTGQIGLAVAQNLLDQGWFVSITHRGNNAVPQLLVDQGIREIIHDRDQDASLSSIIGQGADAVIDTIAFDAVHADQLLEIQGDVGSIVAISSSSVYCDDQGRTLDEARANGFPHLPKPMKETQPTVPPSNETYSTKKVALERRLLDRATTPITILRPGAIHGIASVHPREWWFVKRMMDGRPVIPLAYRGESRFHTTSVANIAALIGIVLKTPATRILNVGDETALSVGQIGEVIGRHLEFNGQFALIDDDAYPPSIGATPWSVPAPFMIDNSAAEALGFRPLPYAATVGSTCDWFVQIGAAGDWQNRFPMFARYNEHPFNYPAEDAFLAGGNGAPGTTQHRIR
ncbi:NAD-dependent epimerase/dehydratase family protein [Rhizobium mongolense]|uniref:NAD-dependent epimerase/dehydratase family protein n=1 Tax=Rhizobium mongolense TaxID=57676 RepID=UPI0035563B7E